MAAALMVAGLLLNLLKGVRGVLVVPESMLGEGQPQELDGATIVGMMVIGPETARLETGRINAIDVGSEVILKEIATAALAGAIEVHPDPAQGLLWQHGDEVGAAVTVDHQGKNVVFLLALS